jgi:hypothetical protein
MSINLWFMLRYAVVVVVAAADRAKAAEQSRAVALISQGNP